MTDHKSEQTAHGDYSAVAGPYGTATVTVNINGREIRLPFQLPRRSEHFTDREAELKQLLSDLRPGHTVTLCGPGGIGKSALAAEAVWQLCENNEPPEQFPDGIIWHDFYKAPKSAQALEHISLSFGEEPKPTPLEAAQRALSGRRALLLLDGTEDTDDLRAVRDVTGNCGVIVTSRKRRDAASKPRDIGSLEADEAVKLLKAWGEDLAEDESAARRICDLAGGLPLAIRLAGRYLLETGETAEEYLEWLEETPLDALNQGERRLDSVPLLLKRSLDQVSGAARDVLAAAGMLAFAPFGREVITAAFTDTPAPDIKKLLNDLSGLLSEIKEGDSETSRQSDNSELTDKFMSLLKQETEKSPEPAARQTFPPELRKALNELVSYGLLTRTGKRWETSHALVHTYAREELSPDDEIIRRLAGYYEAFAEEHREHGPEGYARLDGERAHIMKVLEGCGDRGEWQAVSDLVWAAEDYLDMQGYQTERLTALEAGVKAAQELGHRQNKGSFLGNLGNAYSDLGQVEKAIEYYEQALAISREIGHRQGEGNRLGNLGLAYSSLGQVEKAIEYYEQALAISREIGHRQGEGSHLGNLGNAYRSLGQVEKAIEYYEQALAISREIGHRQMEGSALGNLGLAYSDLGQVEKAIEYYEQALAISREIGHRQGEGSHLG
ncbi:tetratricopeptide repeat protein, partial [Desulfococcaceae bacterium HSG8]|nr:tetratricopeptide repeat protein [Desulfococcaceae bacterium HSG8]